MDEINSDPPEINPITGAPILKLDKGQSIVNLPSNLKGPVIDMGGNPVSEASQRKLNEGKVNPGEIEILKQVNPITGQAYNHTDGFKMYDGVNRGFLSGTQEIEYKNGTKDKKLTASAMMDSGFTPTTENDWEDIRAEHQWWGEKAAKGTWRMITTGLTTAGETLFGSATGAGSFAMSGGNAMTKRAVESYIAGEELTDEQIAKNESKTGLDAIADFAINGISDALGGSATAPGDSVTLQEQKAHDEKKDRAKQQILKEALANDADLMSSLKAANMTLDDAVMAIKEEQYQRSWSARTGDKISGWFGGKIGYNQAGGYGSQEALKKYKESVQKTFDTKNGPDAWTDVASAYWDTSLGNGLDEIREKTNQALPIYYTNEEKTSDEINWVPFEEGSANFYYDKVFNGVGFAAGAMAPMLLTKGKGGGATTFKAVKNLFSRKSVLTAEQMAAGITAESAAAERTMAGTAGATANVERAIAGTAAHNKRVQKVGRLLVSSYAASYSEASVESRDVKRQYIEARMLEWEAANPGKSRVLMMPEERAEIERYANAAGNTNFAINMPILMGTNMFTFSMLMGSSLLAKTRFASIAGKSALGAEETVQAARIAGAAGSATEATWFTSKAGKIVEKVARKGATIGKGAAIEGGQELAQYGSQQFNLSYWHQRQTDDTASVAEHFANAFEKTFTEKEGLEQGLIGAMIGGGMSAIATRGNSKAQKQATEKLLAIRNSGILSNITQRAEMSSETQVMMEDYHKETQKGNHGKAATILAKVLASEARIAEEFGGGELYEEMLNEMENMSPEEFTKYALPHLGEAEAKAFTENHVKDTVKEVRESLKRNMKLAKNIKEAIPSQEKSSPLERWTMSQEQRDNEDMQIRVTEAYRNILYHSAAEMENHEGRIKDLTEQINKKLQDGGMPSFDPNLLRFSIKAGAVKPDADGKVTVESIQDVLGTAMSKSDLEHFNLFYRALDPQDREEFNNSFQEMLSTAAAREQAVNAYEQLRKNPDKRGLYYEALQADQSENLKERRNAVAEEIIKTAKTADQLANSLPNITDEELKGKALQRIKELRKRQSEVRKDKFSDMSVEDMRKLDYEKLSPMEKAAYNEALKFKKNSDVRAALRGKVDAILANSDLGVFDIGALFKGINRESHGDKILATLAQQLQIKIGARLGEPVVVTGSGIVYDNQNQQLMIIAQYELQSDPNKKDQFYEAVENIAGLDQFEDKFKELLANEVTARNTTKALTPETEIDDLGQRILEEERRTSDPSLIDANNLVTNVDTETVEVAGIRTQAPTGRGFLIGGRRYENSGITILDAVNFDSNGQASSVTLFDVEKQEYYTFRRRRGDAEVDVIDAVYHQILLAMDFRGMTSLAPLMTEEEGQAIEEDRQQTMQMVIDETINPEFARPVDQVTNDEIKSQILRLDSNIRILNKILDSYYADYYALGYTAQDANKDETIKKLRSLITGMQKMHNVRHATLLDRNETLQLEVGSLQNEIVSLENELETLSTTVDKLQKTISDNQEMISSGLFNINTSEGAKDIAQLQNEITSAQQLIAYNERKIANKTNQITEYNGKIDELMGRRTVSAEGTQEAAAGQITEEQSQRIGETSEDTGLDELGTNPGETQQRLEEEKQAAEEMGDNTHTDQAGGQVNLTGSVDLQFSPQNTPDSTAPTMSVQLDIQLTKGEYQVDNNWKVLATADENGLSIAGPNNTVANSRIVVNSRGEKIDTITIDRKALGNPDTAKSGTTVVFEVREDTKWWQEEGRDSLPEDRHWEQVPIYVKIIEDKPNALGQMIKTETYVGLLSGFKEDSKDGYKGNTRKIIYDTIKNGGTATSTVRSKKVATGPKGNIINLRTAPTKDAAGNIVSGQVVFVNPASENGLGTRFVNGKVTSATPIVAIATGVETKDAEGNVTDVSRRWELGNTQGLTPTELSSISYALEQAMSNYDTLTDAGVVAFLVQDPNGNYRVVQGSTRFLTQEAQDAAIDSLKRRDVDGFNQIVGTNKIKASVPGYMYVEEVSKNWGAVEGKNGVRVTFWSPLANSLVSVQYDKLLTAIEEYKRTGNADLAFSFTAVEQTDEGGKDFKSASRPKEEFDKFKPLMTKDFLDQLAKKRFQVSKALLGTNQSYVSPINPERTYNSYTDYLFSETEAQENRKDGVGSKAILASDVANNGYGSVFFDIGLEFGTIESNGVAVEVKEELKAQEFDQPTSTPTPAATTVTADINLGLPTLPGMPGAPTAAPAATPTTTPTTTAKKAAIEKDEQGNFIPKKYTLNAIGENPAPNISLASIKEKSFGEKLTDVKQIKLLEIRGKNSKGETVGTVWIQKEDGQSYTAEVYFNDAELVALEDKNTTTPTTQPAPAGPTVEELEKERDELIQPLEQEKSELEKLLEGNQNTPTVEETVENEITEEEMTELQEELGGTVEEVREQVVAEVVNQMNDKNPAPPTSLLQKIARRIKRILLNLMIGTVLFNSMSFTYSGNAKAATYETVNVENLQSFESAYIDQEATNRLENLNIITGSFEGSNETYLIVDKSNAVAHLFQGDSLVNTFEVGTGRKAGDAQTETVVKNGKVLWQQGNQQTGAGIYTVGGIGQYKTSPSYTLKNENGLEVPTVLHETLENRQKLFGDNNVGNNRMSFGCVNFKAESIKRLASYKNFKGNSKVFILPDDAANKFQIVDGELRFVSQDANVNRTVKGYTAQPISIKTERESAVINTFTASISDNKAQLMALYPSISNANYNQIASIAYGILGQESSFGTFGGPRGQYGKVRDDAQVLLGKGVPSVGVTQVRYTSVNKKVRDSFGIKGSKDIKDNPEMAAVATMAVLLDIYENEIPTGLKQDFRSLLPLGYSNRTEFAKAVAGDSTTYENQYVRNVNAFAEALKVYQGLAESETKQEESKSSQQAPVSFTLIGLAAAVRRRQASGETMTPADELVIRNRIAQIDTEIANIKKLYTDRIKDAGKAPVVQQTQQAPQAPTASNNSAITTTRITTKDNIDAYERLNSSDNPRERSRVSYLNAAAYSIAKQELENEAKKTIRGKILGTSTPSDAVIKARAKEVVKRILSNVVAPSNTAPVQYSVYDVLGGYSQKHGNTTENANYDDRYYWGTGKDVYYHYVGYTQAGQRALVVVVPNTDTSNVTRPATVTSMSFILPNNISATHVASSVESKAKEVLAQAKMANIQLTSKMMIDSVLPVVKEAYTGKARPAQEAVPASVAASFEALQAQQEKDKAAKEAKAKEETVEVDQWKTHTVKKGETLTILAAKYKTTVKDIKQANNLKSNFVRPGQNLKIKFKVTKKVSAVAPPKTVTPVETLTREQLESLLDELPGTEITPEIANQISAEESTRISEEFGNELGDDVSLPDDNLIEIMGVKYPKNDINSKLLTSLGLSAQEANEILKLIC